MTDISAYIYEDQNKFYFDPENYTGDANKTLHLQYEDGDMIKWTWDNKILSGILREEGYKLNLFVIQNIKIIKSDI